MEEFIMLKGLQKPLEFQGVRGRFLLWLAVLVGVAMLGGLVLLIVSGFFAAAVFLAAVIGGGYLFIRVKQREGLHHKKRSKDTFVYTNLFKVKK